MFANILSGLLFIFIGLALCYYSSSSWLVRVFGRNGWAELHLGGTKNLLIVIGFVLVVMGLLLMFGGVSMKNPADQIVTGFVVN